MTLFTGLLQDELPETDERRSHVLRVARELGYLERVVNEFLDYARRPKPELAPIAAKDLLAEVAQLVAADADAAGVAVVTDGDAAIVGDFAQLRRALLNLARNAVQASPRGETVTLRADAGTLAVRNHGETIPADTLDKIFDPFFTTREKGTGLGLAFVRDIARDHGGAVEVTSARGETEFRIIIPRGA
jgi:signal transduction histidine kinase